MRRGVQCSEAGLRVAPVKAQKQSVPFCLLSGCGVPFSSVSVASRIVRLEADTKTGDVDE